MALFTTPEAHDANPPATWRVVKVADRRWHLTTSDGGVLDSFTTRRDAEQERDGGRLARLYAEEGRWYAGVTPPGHRSWAECLAERERTAAFLARKAEQVDA